MNEVRYENRKTIHNCQLEILEDLAEVMDQCLHREDRRIELRHPGGCVSWLALDTDTSALNFDFSPPFALNFELRKPEQSVCSHFVFVFEGKVSLTRSEGNGSLVLTPGECLIYHSSRTSPKIQIGPDQRCRMMLISLQNAPRYFQAYANFNEFDKIQLRSYSEDSHAILRRLYSPPNIRFNSVFALKGILFLLMATNLPKSSETYSDFLSTSTAEQPTIPRRKRRQKGLSAG